MKGQPCHPHPSLLMGCFQQPGASLSLNVSHTPRKQVPPARAIPVSFSKESFGPKAGRESGTFMQSHGAAPSSLLACSVPVPGTAHPSSTTGSEKAPFVTPQTSGGSSEAQIGTWGPLPVTLWPLWHADAHFLQQGAGPDREGGTEDG